MKDLQAKCELIYENKLYTSMKVFILQYVRIVAHTKMYDVIAIAVYSFAIE